MSNGYLYDIEFLLDYFYKCVVLNGFGYYVIFKRSIKDFMNNEKKLILIEGIRCVVFLIVFF